MTRSPTGLRIAPPTHEGAAAVMRADAPSGSASAEARMQALYEAHARMIYRYLLTLTFGQRQTAEDLLQETMMKVWRNIDALHPDIGRLRPWLFTVARNLAIDAARARNARPREVTNVDVTGIEQVGDAIDGVLTFQLVKQAMARLSPEHRSVILETYFRGRSTSEAARVLGIPEGTVKSRAYHALRTLRLALQTREPDGPLDRSLGGAESERRSRRDEWRRRDKARVAQSRPALRSIVRGS